MKLLTVDWILRPTRQENSLKAGTISNSNDYSIGQQPTLPGTNRRSWFYIPRSGHAHNVPSSSQGVNTQPEMMTEVSGSGFWRFATAWETTDYSPPINLQYCSVAAQILDIIGNVLCGPNVAEWSIRTRHGIEGGYAYAR